MDDDEREPPKETESANADNDNAESGGDDGEEWVKKASAAEISGVGKSTLYDWYVAGTIVGKMIENDHGKPELHVRVSDCLRIRELRGEGRFKRKPQTDDASENAEVVKQLAKLLEPHHRVLELLMTLFDKTQGEKQFWEERYRQSADTREEALSKQHKRTLEREDRDYDRKQERKKAKKHDALFREGIDAMKTYGPILVSRFAKTDKLHEASITQGIGNLPDETVQAIIDSGQFDDRFLTAIIEIRKAYRKAAGNGKATQSESKTNPKAKRANGSNGSTHPGPGADS